MNLNWFLLTFLVWASAWGQDFSPEFKQSATLGKRYDLLLDRQLSQYFQPGSYVIQSKVYLEEVLTPVEFENGARIFDGQEALPGLPVLPKGDSMQRYQDSLLVSRYRKDYELKYVDINIIVDTRYSASDIAFIQDFVKMTANLDETRGDRIKVTRRPFPKNPADQGLNPDAPIRKFDSLPPILNMARDSATGPAQMPVAKESISWILWTILGILGALLLSLLIWFLISRKKESNAIPEKTQGQIDDLMGQVQALKTKTDEAPKFIPPLPVDARSPEWREGRNFLINQLVGNPRVAGQIFESWIEGKGANGVQQSVMALESLDYRLIRMFKNNMGAESLAKLELGLQTFPGAG